MKNFILITPFLALIVILIFLQHAASLSPIQQKVALFQFKQSFNITTPKDCYYYSYSRESYYSGESYYSREAYYSRESYPKTMNWSMSSDHCTWEGVNCEHETGDVIGLDLSCSQLEGDILPNSTLFQLSHLRFLNLSQNDFSNQLPQEFGFFAKGLISLDLSYNFGAVKLGDEVFKSMLQNLTQLRVLNLHGVNISSVLPVNLSTSLRVLNLQYTSLHGVLPQEVFHLPNLEILALGGLISVMRVSIWEVEPPVTEAEVQAVLPKVKWGSSGTLQHLILNGINFPHGGIPDSIGFLESLATLELVSCSLSGQIPRSIGNLGLLTYLGLQFNSLNGPILTLLANLTNLRYLDLSYNNFTGPLPSFIAHFKGLIRIDLSDNGFTGPLPPGLFNHTSLQNLGLTNNGFTGQLYEFDSSKSQLNYFGCGNNLLNGPIPHSFSQLVNLTNLNFSSNNFNGVLDFEMFSGLEHLESLDLSHNSLSVRSTNTTTLPPKLSYLGLSSCNMKEFPHFLRDAEISLDWLDLSNNEIDGEIPHWTGSVTGYLYLNISHNRLTGGLERLPWDIIQYLDLQSNKLNGSLPTLICSSRNLQVLNLSNNTLSGVLPICRTNLTSLSVFDLRMNKIQGNIPATLSNFRNLETINLNGNKLEGRIPSSFAEFAYLQVFDLGNNQIKDAFPQCLEALPNLQVLVLKSNKFHGIISKSSEVEHPFQSLRIIDLSYNDFSGPLPAIYFRNFKSMMNGEVNKIKRSYMERGSYYSDSTNLVIKGNEILLNKILTIYTTIDVSKNNFEGRIPVEIGYLVSLRFLNLSHNHLKGQIPPLIGKLIVLESLDLSTNHIEGEIPQQLTGLYSLALLNLSCNQLRGHIPEGFQFDTFGNDSYVGNLGLCGNPLSKKCGHYNVMQEEGENEDNGYFFSGFTWEAVGIGYGCGVVPGFIIGYLMLLARKPKWFAGIIAGELSLKIRRMEIKWK